MRTVQWQGLPSLLKLPEAYLKVISIKALIAYLLQKDSIVIKGEKAKLPTRYGDFTVIPFIQKSNGFEHIALIKGTWTAEDPVLVRIHSSCLTGDVFGSLRCDCGSQLHEAMRMVDKAGQGVVIILTRKVEE
jgi:3,4-dihydroxy 2-butanone 4-phosphate synthase/GTP cyclohydrolase II